MAWDGIDELTTLQSYDAFIRRRPPVSALGLQDLRWGLVPRGGRRARLDLFSDDAGPEQLTSSKPQRLRAAGLECLTLLEDALEAAVGALAAVAAEPAAAAVR